MSPKTTAAHRTLSRRTDELKRRPERDGCEKQRESLAEALRFQQDAGLFKAPPYAGYPFLMIPELTNPYIPSGSLSPSAVSLSVFPPPFFCTRFWVCVALAVL
ncbi:hypothetical protein MHYP_G00187320 [Metynnis hypsauchen]